MMKVMVVDDEYLAREGLKRTVNWSMFGCEICGEAANGIDGLSKARCLEPDIVITDISMPGLNGLEMARGIREFLPSCSFIVITGYDEFEYARGAIKINAVDFILKPLDDSELVMAVEKAVVEQKNARNAMALAREKLIMDVIKGKIGTESQIQEALRQQHIGLEKAVVILLSNDTFEKLPDGSQHQEACHKNKIIRDVLLDHLQGVELVVESNDDKLLAVVNRESQIPFEELKELQKDMVLESGCIVSMGVSNVRSMTHIRDAYKEALKALENRMYSGKGSIMFHSELKSEQVEENVDMIREKNLLILKLKALDRSGVEKQLKNIYHQVFSKNKTSYYSMKLFTLEVVLTSLGMLDEFHVSHERVLGKECNAYMKVACSTTVSELCDFACQVLTSVVRALREVNVEAKETGIENAVEFIKEHFAESISLKDVANAVYLSESHLSRKMKKVMGISFVEYITKLRTEKAMELLRDSNMKVTDVASMLGYPDYRYFSHTFKKQTGYSPSQWKENNS